MTPDLPPEVLAAIDKATTEIANCAPPLTPEQIRVLRQLMGIDQTNDEAGAA